MQEWFGHRIGPLILDALAQESLRYRDLSREVQIRIHDHVDDKTFTRNLKCLIASEHIQVHPTMVGRRQVKLYEITESGRKCLQLYDACTVAFQNLTSGDSTCASCGQDNGRVPPDCPAPPSPDADETQTDELSRRRNAR